MKYIVQYTLPCTHRVMVGVEAETPEEAKTKAQALFDQGDLWMDRDIPLLFDDFEEKDDGSVLEFTVEQELAATDPWPEPDASVKELTRREAAFRAARLLVEAYQRGEEDGGSVDWDDLDQAYEAALGATQDGESAC